MLYTALNGREGVDVGWPHGALTNEEPQLVVLGKASLVAPKKLVVAGNIEPFGTIAAGNTVVEVHPQLGGHQLVGIDYEHPVVGSRLDGKRAGRLGTDGVALGESDHTAPVSLSYGNRTVGTLHIADKYLVEPLDGFEYLLEILLRIVGIDDYRYFVFAVHWCKDRK
jgi:hypothetical protein